MTSTETKPMTGESVLVLTEDGHGTGCETYPEFLPTHDSSGQNVLAVTYRDAPDAFIDDWNDCHGHPPANIGVIGVGRTMRSVARSATEPEPARPNVIQAVEDPTDLSTLRRTASDCLDGWPTQETPTVVYFDSLTALLRHVELAAAERFIERFTERIRVTGATGYFAADATEHDEATINSLTSLFDRVLELPDGADENGTGNGCENDTETGSSSTEARIEAGTPSVDAVFDVLRASRRRLVLRHLIDESRPVAFDELAERLAAREDDGAGGEVSADVFRRVYTSLYQIHVPKLVDYGIVEYDRERKVVTLRDDISGVRRFLTLAAEYESGTVDESDGPKTGR